jgi:hypothetical protein
MRAGEADSIRPRRRGTAGSSTRPSAHGTSGRADHTDFVNPLSPFADVHSEPRIDASDLSGVKQRLSDISGWPPFLFDAKGAAVEVDRGS